MKELPDIKQVHFALEGLSERPYESYSRLSDPRNLSVIKRERRKWGQMDIHAVTMPDPSFKKRSRRHEPLLVVRKFGR
jgi:hypothetical protein